MRATNQNIVTFIEQKEAKGEAFSRSDIEFISQYSGKGGAKNTTDTGILTQFYTPDWICTLMYDLACFHGYSGGTVLDPSMGTGNIIAPFPDKSMISGFDVDEIGYKIAKLRFPEIVAYNQYFETAFLQSQSEGIYGMPFRGNKTTWLQGYPFDLVITNPPYGAYNNFYSGRMKPVLGKVRFSLTEFAFFLYGLKLLKPGGLLVFITGQNVMRNGLKYERMKQEIGKHAELLDAYRLPPIFKKTKVAPDIIVLRKTTN